MSMRIASIRQVGGVNSIDNFARSWTRAAAFPEIVNHARPSFRYADPDVEHASPPQHDERSLLRAALTHDGRRTSDNAIDEEDVEHHPKGPWSISQQQQQQPPRGSSATAAQHNSFRVEPTLSSVFGGSYGTSYGSMGVGGGAMPRESLRHHSRPQHPSIEHPMAATAVEGEERQPLLVKQVEDSDGQVVNVVVGQSTLPQTIFNSVNVLIGVGLLALPLALRYSGWLIGLVFLTWAAVVTSYTAKVLAKCLDKDASLITFSDLAHVSFGPRANLATSLLFTLELLGACVALVVLFADSLDALFPGSLGLVRWKLLCGLVLLPLSFAPLRLLSFTSVLGILACTMIVLAVFADGLIKPHAPGSLRSPMPTYLFPENWATVPISLGLLMSPWGGHGVFPNIYRDMRHPYKYRRAVDLTYAITSVLDFFMAIVGLLMFGDTVRDEVTSNVLRTANEGGYPQWISVLICVCIAVIPLTKIPLNARPIIATVEILLRMEDPRIPAPLLSRTGLARAAVRLVCTAAFVALAIVVPSFDRIMSLVGSVACFTICIILPLAFHLKLYGKEIGRGERAVNWGLIVVSTVLALVSTVCNCLPKEVLGLA